MQRAEVEQLYRSYGSLVLRRARRILADEEQARDALQDVFVRAIRSGEAFRGDASPVTWLYRITTNLCLNRIRDARRRRDKLEAEGTAVGEARARDDDLRLDVARALSELPADLSEVAVYYYFDEMDQQEIAQLLGVARRTVGYRLERFASQARDLLGHELPSAAGEQPS